MANCHSEEGLREKGAEKEYTWLEHTCQVMNELGENDSHFKQKETQRCMETRCREKSDNPQFIRSICITKLDYSCTQGLNYLNFHM